MQKRLPLWAITAALALSPSAAHAQGPLSVYVSGLNNPYGLAFGPNGGLYIAESGTGGATPAFTNGAGTAVQFGDTGSVGEYLNGTLSQVITGLPSLGPAGGGETTGLQGLTFSGSTLYGMFGLGATPSQLATFVAANPGTNAAELGDLVNLSANTPVFNLSAYETQAQYNLNNPDGLGQTTESNPYDVTALSNGGGFAVTDGGGNVVLKVAANGSALSLLSALPAQTNPLPFGPPKYQSVPTAITTGPNGSLLVGEFGGFPAPAGGSSVFSIDPVTGATSVFASGFTAITGLAFGPNGDLYVLDDSTGTYYGPPSNAQLIQYNPANGTKQTLATLPLGPGGSPIDYTSLIAGPDNALYLSSQGNDSVGSGQVLRFSLAVPEAPAGALLALGLLPLAGLAVAKRRRVGPARF